VFAGASPRQQLLGFGLGADRIITLGFDDPRVFGTSSHNDLVGVIIETGIVGAVFFVWLLAALGREILHMERMATDAHQLVLVRTATILWVTFILLGVTSRPLQYPSLSWPVLVVIGGVLGMRNRLDAHRN
jgi:O-antigen ligase